MAKNKDNAKDGSKLLKKELKKNIKAVREERKKAIKKVKKEKEKAINAIKKLSTGNNVKNESLLDANDDNKKRSEAVKSKLEKENTSNQENDSVETSENFQSVDLKADEAVARVKTFGSRGDIESFVKGEKRSSILKAAHKRTDELEQRKKETK